MIFWLKSDFKWKGLVASNLQAFETFKNFKAADFFTVANGDFKTEKVGF